MPIGVLSSYSISIDCKIKQKFDKLYQQALILFKRIQTLFYYVINRSFYNPYKGYKLWD